MSGHTPGPWYCGAFSIVNASETTVLETVHAMRVADAKLIAAAPELLDALKLVLALYEETKQPLAPGVVHVAIPWLIAVRSAIAKAEGRS